MFSIYLIAGAFAGVMSGLFGIGGGIVVVPALSGTFGAHTNMPANAVMHMAIGTSLAIMIITSFSSLYAHNKRSVVRWPLVFEMLPGLVIGAIIGSLTDQYLSSQFLRIFFGLFLVFIGIRLLIQRKPKTEKHKYSRAVIIFVATIIGLLSAILGIGGGALLVPFLLRCNLDMREATGTSLACGLSIGIVATISFMMTGLLSSETLPYSTGYIYWPAFVGVAITSVLFAPIGAALAHKLPVTLLKRLFSIFILIMACDMLFFSR